MSSMLALLLLSPPVVSAAGLTFSVNRIGDASDINAGNGKCDSSASTGSQCTLRAAIQEANAHAGADVIQFGITSSSKVIKPASELPPITEKLTINGYTQSGASANTLAVGDNAVLKIVLDGTNAGSATGLTIHANGVLVKGLVIENFEGFAVDIRGSNNSLTGNFVGVRTDGATAAANGSGLFVVDSPGTTIGGATAAARNLVSANGGTGVTLIRSSTSTIRGNYIGTNASGSSALGNSGGGINVDESAGVTIGGSTSGAGNVISGNEHAGILTQGASTAVTVQGNRVGVSASGTGDLGNSEHGLALLGGANTIGGAGAAGNVVFFNDIGILADSNNNTITGNAVETSDRVGIWLEGNANTVGGNIVIGNGQTGVLVTAGGNGNRISGNQMAGNGGLGIDLFPFGATANDTDDPDTGQNNLQNFPVLASAVHASNGVTTVSASLNSLHSTSFTIEFFTVAADPSGHGEGFIPLGAKTITTDSGGDKSFTFATAQLGAGQQVTATATNSSTGDTSEFSANVVVVSGP